jgi:hypothetical protein
MAFSISAPQKAKKSKIVSGLAEYTIDNTVGVAFV